jgi:PAS domain-containing protein/DNA-binding CsgD family transcriptional regulator
MHQATTPDTRESERAIERIYEAALDPARLPEALASMAAATGAIGGMVGIYDPVAGGGHAPATHGLDPALLDVYEQRFQLNPWARWVARHAPVGRAASCEPELDIDVVAAEDPEFHDSILKPQGIVGQSMYLVRRDGRFTVGVPLMFSERGRAALPEVQREHDRFGGHLQRAFELMQQLDTLRHRLQASEDALDRVRCAVFVLDAQAAIHFANRAARALLAAGDGLVSVGRALGARVNGDGVALRALIAQAAGCSGPRGARAQAASLRIHRGVDRLPLAAIAVPATPRQGPLGEATRHVLLFVADPAAQCGIARELLRDAFGLTEREVSVALATLRLGGLPAAAGELRIALTTARSHLQHVFDKTSTRNQVALAQMLASLGALPDATHTIAAAT